MTMTNGNKRDKTNNKSTISTPTRNEVQRRRKDGSNDTTDAKIDDQVRMVGKPSSAAQDSDGRQEKQEKQTTLNQFVMGSEKKVLLPKSFFAGRIDASNHAYRQLHTMLKKNQEGFKQGELYGEGANTFHTMSNGCKAVIEQAVREPITLDTWTRVFDRCFNSDVEDHNSKATLLKFRKLAVKLALSDPLIMFDANSGLWDDGALLETNSTAAWFAAYQRFGAPWKTRDYFQLEPVTPDKEPKDTDINSEKDSMQVDSSDEEVVDMTQEEKSTNQDEHKSSGNPTASTPRNTVAFDVSTDTEKTHPTNPPKQSNNAAFLSEPLKDPKALKQTKLFSVYKKQRSLIMKARLPDTQNIDSDSQTREVLHYIQAVFKSLWNRDSSVAKPCTIWRIPGTDVASVK